MRKIFLLSIFAINIALGQAITIDPTTGGSGNINVNSTTGGVVIARMTSAQRTAISNPVQGLMVFQTDGDTGFYVNKSSILAIPNWVKVTEGDNLWIKNIISPNDMYALNSGNVGIGMTSPSAKVDISANGTTATVRALQTGTTGNAGLFEINNASNGTYALYAKTNGTESAGLFEINNASSVRPALYGSTTGSGMAVFGYAASGAGGYFTATSGLALRTGTGNVAIGAATAPDKLTVTTTSNSYGITHTDGTTSVSSYVSSLAGWLGTKSNHPLYFYTNGGSSQMTLTTAGIVGIGNTTPIKAGLVVDKKVGAANAVFGESTTGVSIESAYPGISFNGYYNTSRRSLADGYVGGFTLNPTTGLMVYYNTNVSWLAATSSINSFDRLAIDRNGKVGIGLNTPDQLLDVNGRMRIRHNGFTSGVWMSNSLNGVTTADGSFFGQKADTQAGIYIGDSWRFWVDNAGVVNAPNFLQVGTTAIPTGYKMSVDGKVICSELEVLVTPWPDYVFKPSYQLKPLHEVESFIVQHGHLPNIPKAADIENKALAIGNMSRLQMEKIEELTLYVIEINKKLQKMEAENAALQKEIKALKTSVTLKK